MKHRIPLAFSSSTQVALFFSTLLIITLSLLSVEVYNLSDGEGISPNYTHLIVALVTFICVGLFIVSFYYTKRINVIADTADRIIMTRDLSQRIPIENPWHDLSKLARALNAMLDEIEQLVAGIRQVSDNVAHDLRTPLTRMRNHIEGMRVTAARSPNQPDDQQDEFNMLVMECDGLLATFNALLRIANIEAGRRLAAFHTVDLAPVVQDVVELYEPVAAEKSVTLHYASEPTFYTGDKDLLFQAVANLLDNAIKYTPLGGEVHIALRKLANGVSLRIADTGPGIADEHKPFVFRRFYRVSTCRNAPGSGLGLSLVNAIVRLHKGSILLENNHPSGLIVSVMLPVSAG